MDAATPKLPLPVLVLMPTKHLGNLLVSLASVAALAQAAGERSLVVLDERYRAIADAAPQLGPVLYFPRLSFARGDRRKSLAALWQFFRALRRFNGQLALDLDGQRLSGWMCRLAGSRVRVGPSFAQVPRAYTLLLPAQREHPHRFHDYAAWCRHLLGAAPAPGYPALASPLDRRALLARLGIDEQVPLASLHVGATKAYKQWPAAHFAALADWLAAAGWQVALIGAGDADGESIAAVLGQCRSRPHDLHDRLALAELIALVRASQLFVGNDSGPMHLAAATGIAVFALFGPTDEARWGPLGGNAQVIRNAAPCAASCSRRHCEYGRRCLTELSPAVVSGRIAAALPGRFAGAAAQCPAERARAP